MSVERPTRAYVAWIAVCLLWGTTYLAMRIALETMPPLLMAGIRWIIAGSIMLALLKAFGQRLPSPHTWFSLAILGILLIGFGNGAVVWAEQTVPSGLTAVLVATSPVWMTGVEAATGGARLTAVRAAGLVLGFAGIVVLVWPNIQLSGEPGFLGGVLAAQLACVGWALGSIYARARGRGAARDENVLATAGFEMLFGGLFLLTAGTLGHEWGALAFNRRTTSALVYLIVFGALGGFTCFAYALKYLPVATVSLYAFVNPVIAVILGTLVLQEPMSWRIGVAGLIVLAGMALVREKG